MNVPEKTSHADVELAEPVTDVSLRLMSTTTTNGL